MPSLEPTGATTTYDDMEKDSTEDGSREKGRHSHMLVHLITYQVPNKDELPTPYVGIPDDIPGSQLYL